MFRAAQAARNILLRQCAAGADVRHSFPVPPWRVRVQNAILDLSPRAVWIENQMVAKGGLAEGYGSNAVALCGLP